MLPPAPDDPSRELLLELLGRPRMPDEQLRRRAAGADWQRVISLAGGPLLPMLDFRTRERGIAVPGPAREALANARGSCALLDAQRRLVLRAVGKALDEGGIPFVLLKGFALAHEVYPAPDTRPMSDVDFWVGDNIAKAAGLLGGLGWRAPWWRQRHARYSTEGEEVGLRLDGGALMIELHRHPRSLAAPIPGELPAIWARRVPAPVGGIPAAVLAPDDALLYLALHLGHAHRFVGALHRLLDVTLLVERHGAALDWPAFAARCRALGIAGWVATTLATARAMLGCAVGDDTLRAFAVDDLDRFRAMASEHCWLSGQGGVRPQSVMAAPTVAARARLVVARLGGVLMGEGAEAARPSPARLARRIRYALRFTLPKLVRAARGDAFRGDDGAALRRLSAENQVLVDSLRRTIAPGSPSASARP